VLVTVTTTLGNFITRCQTCGQEVHGILAHAGALPTLSPCGHPANLTTTPNPELPPCP